MNSNNEHASQESSDALDQELCEPPRDLLFVGDSGELPAETRRVLVQLLAGPSLDGRRHQKLWPILIRDEVVIRRRLNELFLDLVLDAGQQVAFTRQAETGDLESPILLRRMQLTFVDSVLLLFLRQQLGQADAHGERAVVDTKEIQENLGMYERAANTDHAGFIKRVAASIEKFKKSSILQKVKSSDDRYEISPTLKLLFSAEDIPKLTQLYKRMAEGEEIAPGESEDEEAGI